MKNQNNPQAIILSNYPSYPSQKMLGIALKKKGFKVNFIAPQKYSFSPDCIDQKKVPQFLFHRSLGPYFDDFDLRISEHYKGQGTQIVNPLEVIKKMRNKAEQWIYFKSLGIEGIPTFFQRSQIELKSIQHWQKSFLSKKNLPYFSSQSFVVKSERGSKGIGTFLLHGLDSLLSLWETMEAIQDQRFIIQPLIQSVGEYRLFVVGQSVVACALKKGKDFRKNAHRALNSDQSWQNISLQKIPRPLLSCASQIAYELKGDYLGLDFFWHKSWASPLLIECNASPGIDTICQVSKKDLAKLIINNLT